MRELIRRPLARASLLGLILVLFGWAGWWWTHPSLLHHTSPLGNGVFAPKPVSQAVSHVSVASPVGNETIELRSIAAQFAVNTAEAQATFNICKHRRGTTPIGSVGGDEPLSKYCSEVRPVTDGTKVHITEWKGGEPHEYILMTITATAPGTARIDQISFKYSRAWRHLGQRGTETDEQRWVVRATAD